MGRRNPSVITAMTLCALILAGCEATSPEVIAVSGSAGDAGTGDAGAGDTEAVQAFA
ncbi:MAG: hypothetical protein O2998_00670 [Actinomycetota bacterium]|nr:hypothetical protein [Actinomycetota bacterium]